jgi:hypothetical protein
MAVMVALADVRMIWRIGGGILLDGVSGICDLDGMGGSMLFMLLLLLCG